MPAAINSALFSGSTGNRAARNLDEKKRVENNRGNLRKAKIMPPEKRRPGKCLPGESQ